MREAAYNYVKDNLTEFYEFCYVEDGCYYTDIEEGGVIKKYILDDYVKELKNDKVYSGYIEINPLTSPGEGVTIFTFPYLSAGAPEQVELKGLMQFLKLSIEQ